MKCFIDLDGVLADFCGSLRSIYQFPDFENRPYKFDLFDEFELDKDDFWNNKATVDFWANLSILPKAQEIVKLCSNAFGAHNLCFLSSPGYGSAAARAIEGKQIWINKHFYELRKQVLFGSAKHFCANPHAVLIDDYDKNIEEFNVAGGWGILVPRPYNKHWNVNFDEIQMIKEFIKFLS